MDYSAQKMRLALLIAEYLHKNNIPTQDLNIERMADYLLYKGAVMLPYDRDVELYHVYMNTEACKDCPHYIVPVDENPPWCDETGIEWPDYSPLEPRCDKHFLDIKKWVPRDEEELLMARDDYGVELFPTMESACAKVDELEEKYRNERAN
jgi:hypothetical protein